MKKMLLCGLIVAVSQGFSGLGLGFFRKLKPGALPSIPVAGFDASHRASDIEDVAAALLRLRDEAQCMAAKRMVGKQEIKHRDLACKRWAIIL
jgi:hypothetical protein